MEINDFTTNEFQIEFCYVIRQIIRLNTDKFMLSLFQTQMNVYKNNNYHYIPLVDLGFKIDTNDTFYNEGHSKNAFLISNYTKQELIAYNLPGQIVFPDFLLLLITTHATAFFPSSLSPLASPYTTLVNASKFDDIIIFYLKNIIIAFYIFFS